MRRSSPILPLLAVAICCAGGRIAAQNAGSQDQITGVISAPGLTRMVLAMPAFRLSPITPEATRNAAAEIQSTLTTDLEFSGYFDVLPPERFSGFGDDPSKVPFRQWASTGAVALLLGTVTPESGTLMFQGMLFDTQSEQLILGKRYRGEPSVARIIAHRLADEIVLHFTGRMGIAQTHIAVEGRVGKAKEIFTMDYDGQGLRQMTRNGSLNLSPAFSPDGKKIAFVSYSSGSPRLYVMDPDGKLTDVCPKEAELCAAPAWSPDGKSVVFSAASAGNSEIYVSDAVEPRPRRLTHDPASDTSPAYAPDGRQIAFTSDRAGSPQIYVMDASGSNPRRLTYQGRYNDQAAWSPDGALIAYAGWTENKFDIFVADPATGTAKRLTDDLSFNEHPDWSPDGRHIAFTSNRLGIYQLFTMDADGGRQLRVKTSFEASSPSWGR